MSNLLDYFKAKRQHYESNQASSSRTVTSREIEEVKKQLEIPYKNWEKIGSGNLMKGLKLANMRMNMVTK